MQLLSTLLEGGRALEPRALGPVLGAAEGWEGRQAARFAVGGRTGIRTGRAVIRWIFSALELGHQLLKGGRALELLGEVRGGARAGRLLVRLWRSGVRPWSVVSERMAGDFGVGAVRRASGGRAGKLPVFFSCWGVVVREVGGMRTERR